MKKKFICKKCGKEYYSYKENSNFCSKECKIEYRNSIKYDCDYCGKEFITTESVLNSLKSGKHKNLFCSRECANKFMNKSVEKICEECGKSYKISNAFKDIQKYCSRECYENHRGAKISLLKKICPICKKTFTTYHKPQIYCSKECRGISDRNRKECTCDYCGKTFERIVSEVDKNKKHYCSNACRMNAMYWNKKDIDTLREYYGKVSKEEIIKLIPNWNYSAIRSKAQWLGLTKSREWSDGEVKLLLILYPSVPMSEVLLSLPKRTMPAILGKARKLGLLSYFYINNVYSEEDENYLRDNYLAKSNEELAERLNTTPNGIAQHLYHLNLHRPLEKHNYGNLNNYMRARLTTWKQKYREDCNYTCEVTGSRSNIIVHHIRSFNILMLETIEQLNFPLYEDLDDYTREQLDIFVNTFLSIQEYYGEYICITENVHTKFHTLYGYGNNTKEQWEEFLKNNYNMKKAG